MGTDHFMFMDKTQSRIRWLLVGTLILLLAGVSPGSGPDADKTGKKKDVGNANEEKPLPVLPLQLTDGGKPEVSFTWREIETGKAVISVWNSSKDSHKLSIRLTDFDLSAGSLGKSPESIQLSVSPDAATINAYAVTRFTLKLADSTVVPPVRGSYSGILSMKADPGKFSPFSQRLRVNVTGPQPAVTKASLIAWRLAPGCGVWWASISLPLNDEYKSSEFIDANRIVGYVHRSYGGIAAVRWVELKPALRDRSSSDCGSRFNLVAHYRWH